MSKGWRIAVVVLLGVAVVVALNLKTDRGKVPSPTAVRETAGGPEGVSASRGDESQPGTEKRGTDTDRPGNAERGKVESTVPADATTSIGTPGKEEQPTGPITRPAEPGKSAVSLKSKKSEGLPKLVDLGAGKCIPCKMMVPILEELKKELRGKLEVVVIDVWENPDAGKKYGIKLIPTQIFYGRDGKEFFRHEGFFSKKEILAKFKERGIEF